jgi:hypothetical protein
MMSILDALNIYATKEDAAMKTRPITRSAALAAIYERLRCL